MAAVATDITPIVAELSDRALGAFCEDIAGMFDADMRCERRQAGFGAVKSLREQFKKLAAVHFIKADGALNGTFHLIFDQGGLFILSGVIVMLPEPRILEGIKRGSLQDAESLQDAAREAGNLLAGSWDRVFREGCPGHEHFLKTNTFIGKPWENGPAELQADGEVLIVLYDMTIEPYPSFTCAAVFPKAVLDGLGIVEVEPPQDAGQRTQDRVKFEVSSVKSSHFTPDTSHSPLTDLLQIPAAKIMEKDVVWAGPDETVGDVIAKMQQQNAGYVLVGRNGVLEGLVSSSNILGAVSLYLRPMFAQWRRPEDDATLGVKVKWIMSRPVRTVRPDATLAAMIESMRRCGGRCLPVVDARGSVQGIVSVFDILLRILEADKSFAWQGRPPQAPALLI